MPAYAPSIVGTCVETQPDGGTGMFQTGRKTTIQWTADGSGNVTYKTAMRFRGEISRVVIDPRTVGAGSIACKLNDSNGLDVLGNAAAAASASVNTQWPGNGSVDKKQAVDEQMYLVLSGLNAGDTGYVYVYSI